MYLLIDTTEQGRIILALLNAAGRIVSRKEKKVFYISEHLLPEIAKFLRKHKVELEGLTKILVNPGPGGFSSTRTGVATANALVYALGIKVAEWPSGRIREVVLPKYDKEPNITRPKK